MALTTFEKLAYKIKSELDLELIDFKRQYVGYWQRSQGAWLWVATTAKDGISTGTDVGSTFSATDLLKSKKLCIACGNEILPED